MSFITKLLHQNIVFLGHWIVVMNNQVGEKNYTPTDNQYDCTIDEAKFIIDGSSFLSFEYFSNVIYYRNSKVKMNHKSKVIT